MKRREFLHCLGLATLGHAVFPASAVLAAIECAPFNEQGIQQCQVGIRSEIMHVSAASVGGQHQSQWCWAACIEMVFRYYGFEIPQVEIVRQTWGDIVNLPGNPMQILGNLNRVWTDRNGRNFRVYGDVSTANVVTAAQDLAADMPLIIGTMGHAMVLTSLVYLRDRMGQGSVLSAIVRDPWPEKGRRVLTPQEWYNVMFLARIRVQAT